MIEPTGLRDAIDEFLSHLRAPPAVEYHGRTLQDLDDGEAWKPWGRQSGIYVFATASGDGVYVGRALARSSSSDLGARVLIHSQSWPTDPDRGRCSFIAERANLLWAVTFPAEAWVWLASLEVFLIDRLDPPFNRRV
jgi:hypothetical protein